MPSPQAIAMDVANAIPGCQAQRFALEANTVLTGRVMGWGPSLHRTGLAWACTPATMDEAGIRAGLEPYVAIQRRRIAAAEALGLATDAQPPLDAIGHIVTDRVLLAMAPALRRDLDQALGKTIQSGMSGRDGEYSWLLTRLLDGDACDPRPRLVADHAFGDMVFDGISLLLPHHIPETLVGSLAGRRVAEVVSADDHDASPEAALVRMLRDRAIVSAEHRGGGLTLRFEGDWTPVREMATCAP